MATNQRLRNDNQFTGQSQGVLESHFIIDNGITPLPQQYDSFVRAVTYATGKNNIKVYRAIEKLMPLEKKECMPGKTEYLKALNTEWEKGLGLDDTKEEEILHEELENGVEDAVESYLACESELKKIFVLILGQLDDGITAKLKARDNWNDIDARTDTIELLKLLRDVCYDINPGHTHPVIDTKRKMNKFVTCTQKTGQGIDDFIDEVQSYFNVLKVAGGGGTIFRSKPLTVSTIERKFPELQSVPYDLLSDEDIKRIEEATDQIIIATVIVEGSKHSSKNKRILHYADVAGITLDSQTGE